MARVPRRGASAQPPLARSRAAKAKAKKHKIVMESVTQAKKKLRSVISFEAKAPPGYTFIPAGNPQLTNACKEACRKGGYKVFAVSTTPHQRMHNLSQQVHRIGYHFPSVVVAASCMELGVLLSSTGKVMTYQEAYPRGGPGNLGRRVRADSEVSQTTINTEARDAIKDLFPNIPDKDLNQIIKTAFQKGQRKVGTAAELPLARRVQLAVVAHIRHVYTQYDRLLRLTSFQEARASVEEPTLAKLVQWRGDDENGKTVLEDVFREVIVISDDEDDDSDAEEDAYGTGPNRDTSVEVISSNALVGELETFPVHYSNLETTANHNTRDPSVDEAPSGFRFVPEAHRRDPAKKKKPDRRGFNRYQAWDRARDRYRESRHVANYGNISRHDANGPVLRPIPESGPEPAQPRPDQIHSHQFDDRPPDFRTRQVERRYEQRVPIERIEQNASVQPNGHNTHQYKLQPMTGRQAEPIEAPGSVIITSAPRSGYERVPAPQISNTAYIPVSRDPPPPGGPPPQVRSHMTASRAYHHTENPDENRVYPSIETPQTPPRRMRVDNPSERGRLTIPEEYPRRPQTPPRRPIDDLSRQVRVIGIDDERDQTLYKRRRVEYDAQLRDNVPREDHFNQVRPVAAPTPNESREPQYISLLSPQSGRGPDRIYPRIPDENTRPLHEITPVVGRQLERHPVGRAPSLIPSSHHSRFLGSIDREDGHNYRAPISLRHPRHDPDASLNSFKAPPPPVSSNRESGHITRDNGYAVRSNQVSNVVEPRSQYVDQRVRYESEGPKLPREEPFWEDTQPMVVREGGPIGHRYISNTQAGGERHQEFPRPFQLRDRETVPYRDMPQFLPRDRQPGPIPQRRDPDPYADEYPSRLQDRPAPGTYIYRYSPKHSYPSTQAPTPGQPRLVRIGPGPASQDADRFMIHSPTSAAPHDMRARPSLDNGRYIRENRSISPRRNDRGERMRVRMDEHGYPTRPFPPREDAVLVAD